MCFEAWFTSTMKRGLTTCGPHSTLETERRSRRGGRPAVDSEIYLVTCCKVMDNLGMSAKKPRSEILEAVRIASLDESKAVEFLEHHRWAGNPGCPRDGCGSMDVYTMRDAETGKRNKDFRWRCRTCKRMFTLRTNTVPEETPVPLSLS